MIRLFVAGLLLVSFNALADTQVTNTFQNGQVIEAEKFNKNFDDLEAAIDTVLSTATGGAIALTSTAGGSNAISLTTNRDTNETIVVTNRQGQSDGAIALTAMGGGITLSAEAGIRLSPGSFSMVSVDGDLTASGTITAEGVAQTSDARLKEAVSSVGVGLGLINDLNPVRYHRINNPESDIEMGLLAQEVEATLAKHGLDNSGMVIKPDEKGYLYLRHTDLLAPIIKAIQELDDASEAKDEQIAVLEQKLKSQQSALQSQQEELLAIVQSQQEQIAQLQSMMGEQFAAR